jgi:hypothetical protein
MHPALSFASGEVSNEMQLVLSLNCTQISTPSYASLRRGMLAKIVLEIKYLQTYYYFPICSQISAKLSTTESRKLAL